MKRFVAILLLPVLWVVILSAPALAQNKYTQTNHNIYDSACTKCVLNLTSRKDAKQLVFEEYISYWGVSYSQTNFEHAAPYDVETAGNSELTIDDSLYLDNQEYASSLFFGWEKNKNGLELSYTHLYAEETRNTDTDLKWNDSNRAVHTRSYYDYETTGLHYIRYIPLIDDRWFLYAKPGIIRWKFNGKLKLEESRSGKTNVRDIIGITHSGTSTEWEIGLQKKMGRKWSMRLASFSSDISSGILTSITIFPNSY